MLSRTLPRPHSRALLALRFASNDLKREDMSSSVKNAANYKVKKIRSDEQVPYRPLYFDGAATTPIDPRVNDQMMQYQTSYFGNPHSTSHAYGWQSEAAVEKARESVSTLIGCDSKEIVFTSGATESNNLAIKGAARYYGRNLKGKKHIITSQIEHKCVLDSCRYLETEEDCEVTYLKPGIDGRISLEDLEQAMTPNTILVSIMAVNNEIGVLQDLKGIGAICKSRKVLFHTDAAQMIGKLPIDVKEMGISLMSISGHKIYGPKGIGALYISRRPRVRLEPIISGGGQERGYRSGTLPHFLTIGLGAACEVASQEMVADHERIKYLSEKFKSKIESELTHVVFNGSEEYNYPGILNLSFNAVEGESLLMSLPGVALSSGSACTSASLEPSYVLRAIGSDVDLAHSSIRFGIGRFTTEAEIDYTAEELIKHVNRLRDLSPLWDMLQEGIDLKSIQWGGQPGH